MVLSNSPPDQESLIRANYTAYILATGMEGHPADPRAIWGTDTPSCKGDEDVHMTFDEGLESLDVDETLLMDIEGKNLNYSLCLHTHGSCHDPDFRISHSRGF